MKRKLFAVAGLVLVALALYSPSTSAEANAKKSPPTTAHERIVKFWTKARVARAKPRDFVFDFVNGRFEAAVRKPLFSKNTMGSTWLSGGEVSRNTGKVLFSMGGDYYLCSAAVVDDPVANRSIVVTAAHCAYDETGTSGFAQNWMFVPDYASKPVNLTTSGSFCASTTYGCWTAQWMVVSNDYATAGSFNDVAVVHDYAFIVVGPGGLSGTAQLDATVGSQPITYAPVSTDADTWLFGYPAARQYKGDKLTYCRGPLGEDAWMLNDTYRVACKMTGGASGGPWFSPFSSSGESIGTGTIMSVNSYGYSGVRAMYGPKFGAETSAMFVTATTTNSNVRYSND